MVFTVKFFSWELELINCFSLFQYITIPPGPVPANSTKVDYGKVEMYYIMSIFEYIKHAAIPIQVNADWPLSFEELSVPSGIVVYQTVIPHMIVR